MNTLNGMFLKQSDRAMYATMTMLKLNLTTQKADLCNAGHHPVLQYVAETGEFVKRHKKGVGLGIVERAGYTNLTFSVKKGDILILYSDGLIETRDEDLNIREAYFFEQIIKKAVADPIVDPEELSASIIAEIEQLDYADRFEDDATLIVIEA